MRIAVIGAYGQLGTALQEVLPGNVLALGRSHIDIANPESVTAAIAGAEPDVVINAAGLFADGSVRWAQ